MKMETRVINEETSRYQAKLDDEMVKFMRRQEVQMCGLVYNFY